MDIPYERQAMAGEPIPDGLSLPDTMLYITLRGIYQQYRAGHISREQGAADKRKAVVEYHRLVSRLEIGDRCREHAVQMWKDIELLTSEYRKNPTLETADKIVQKIYG